MARRSKRVCRTQIVEDDSEEDDSDDEMPSVSNDSRARNRTKSGLSNGRPSTCRLAASQPVRASTSHSSTQLTQQSQNTSANKMPEEEENLVVGNVVRYLLLADQSKTMIQRPNIIKAAMPNHSKYFKYIITKAKATLREVFGYNLVELEGNKYIVTNCLENHELHLNFSKEEKAEKVLLFISLTHIFMMAEQMCKAEEIYDVFRQLKIIKDDHFINDYFGNVKSLMTEKFVRQGYLKLVTTNKSEAPVQHFQWGVRAENEIPPRAVLEFMSKIFGGCPLNTWPDQFSKMQAAENALAAP